MHNKNRIIISIVIVSFNVQTTIEDCLSSIITSDKRKVFEAICIDNLSIDQTTQIISKKFPQVRLIKNKKNIGFAAAVNQGAGIAKGECLLFLNPDTIVKPDCIKNMVNFLKEKKDAGVVGCRILNPNGSLQPSCGTFPTIINIILDRIPILNKLFKTELIRQEGYYEKEQSPDWTSGAFFMVRRDIFLSLGGFDEKYFLYVEDVDFSYRAKKAGYKIYYNPKAEIIHYDMGKSKERKNFKAKQIRIGFTIFFGKYKSLPYLFLWKMILTIELILKPNLKVQ